MSSVSLAAATAFTIPIQQDFISREQAIAQAGYRSYRQGRISRPWDDLKPHEQFRWMLTASLGMASDGPSQPVVLRAVYHTYARVDPWDDMRAPWRKVWGDVAAAMDAARDRFDRATITPAGVDQTLGREGRS